MMRWLVWLPKSRTRTVCRIFFGQFGTRYQSYLPYMVGESSSIIHRAARDTYIEGVVRGLSLLNSRAHLAVSIWSVYWALSCRCSKRKQLKCALEDGPCLENSRYVCLSRAFLGGVFSSILDPANQPAPTSSPHQANFSKYSLTQWHSMYLNKNESPPVKYTLNSKFGVEEVNISHNLSWNLFMRSKYWYSVSKSPALI